MNISTSAKIVIVDYGMGNLRSVEKALIRIGIIPEISADPHRIKQADYLILPGVGHFATGMANLQHRGLIGILKEKCLISKTPILGICLGLQLFTSHSEEGDCPGLNMVDGTTKRFSLNKNLKIPHIGWNSVNYKQPKLISDKQPYDDYFYFVHSYYIAINDLSAIYGMTNYGIDFVSMVKKDNLFGVQFHPEKSHSAGLSILKDFFSWYV